jgi:hypothetical protein
MISLHLEEVEANGVQFRAPGADAVTDRLLSILGDKLFEFSLGLFVFAMGRLGADEYDANSAHAFEDVMSTTRIASIRGFGGS